jgi:hypothetical protein
MPALPLDCMQTVLESKSLTLTTRMESQLWG